ncbi:MAG: Uma2 family endonuclease [Isosphaera sp.]|nr:Uma2 family endonuclease [Isosphaera sp.]
MILKAEKVLFPPNDYPTSDGRPTAETDHHRKLMVSLIDTLDDHFAADPEVYVSGNLLVFYEKGDKRRHVAPDVFVARGVRKGLRPNYLVWEEKTPDVVIELTSKTTRAEDTKTKRALYEGKLKVKEYFLFDPYEDYLDPSFQGYARVRGKFRPIGFVDGRLPSDLLGLHLVRDGIQLRLRDPVTDRRLPTPAERAAAAEAEVERLRRELEQLRGKKS